MRIEENGNRASRSPIKLSSRPPVEADYTFTCISPVSLINLALAAISGSIGLSVLRAFFAIARMLAKRHAAENTTKRKIKSLGFSAKHLAGVMGITFAEAKKALTVLKDEGILVRIGNRLEISKEPRGGTMELLKKLFPERSATRPIPVPMSFLKYCMGASRGSILVLMGYLIRGLSIKRNTGKISSSGRVLIKTLAELAGVSTKQAGVIRKKLIADGLISDDAEKENPKFFRVRHTDGLYFKVNTDFDGKKVKRQKSVREPTQELAQESVRKPVKESTQDLVEESIEVLSIQKIIVAATMISQICAEIDPVEHRVVIEKLPVQQGQNTQKLPVQYKDLDLSKESKRPGSENSENSTPQPSKNKNQISTGVCKTNGGKPAPNIHNVQVYDLRNPTRLESLFHQATQCGLLAATETNVINFIAAAVRATTTKTGDPTKIFMGIVRRQLWKHITNQQEGVALAALKRERQRNQKFFQIQNDDSDKIRQNHSKELMPTRCGPKPESPSPVAAQTTDQRVSNAKMDCGIRAVVDAVMGKLAKKLT